MCPGRALRAIIETLELVVFSVCLPSHCLSLLNADITSKAGPDYLQYLSTVTLPQFMVPPEAAMEFVQVCGVAHGCITCQGRYCKCVRMAVAESLRLMPLYCARVWRVLCAVSFQLRTLRQLSA